MHWRTLSPFRLMKYNDLNMPIISHKNIKCYANQNIHDNITQLEPAASLELLNNLSLFISF